MSDKNYDSIEYFEELLDDIYLDSKTQEYGTFESVTLKAINKKAKKAQKKEKEKIKKIAENKNHLKRKIERNKNVNIFHSISSKMIAIISSIVVISLGTITFLVSHFISQDTQINAEENNLTINRRSSDDVKNRIDSLINNAGMIYGLLEGEENDSLEEKRNVSLYFERNKEVACVFFINSNRFFENNTFVISHEIDSNSLENYILSEDSAIEQANIGNVKVINPSPVFNTNLLCVFAPINNGKSIEVCAVVFSSQGLGESFASSSVNSSFVVNDEGDVLIHGNSSLMANAQNLKTHRLVSKMLTSSQKNMQLKYSDDNGEEYFGAYTKLSEIDMNVITEVKSSVVFEAVQATTRRNIYLTVAILAFAVLLIRFFARSISAPLELLTDVTDQIALGNFETPLFDELNTARKDEIGILNRSTKDEQQILNTVTSLTNKGVTQAIVKKTIDFEPHLKDITIFFSDIRGFTAISDGFNKRFNEKSAGEIIGFLNDYMSRMVNCIKATGGNVDKFEGDAIMACWGVLRDDDLSFEQLPDSDTRKVFLQREHEEHKIHDVISAIRSTIGMRYALMKYNKDAKIFTEEHANEPLAKYKPQIKIGCGLNSGRATVGFMGSHDKMEFTSIGDAVNLASRTESSNKPCGTDILITQDTYDLLKKDYIRCSDNNFIISQEHLVDEVIVEQIPVTFEVKGKGKQHFYGVVNMPNFDIESFFKRVESNFVLDDECKKACGKDGPKNLNDVRKLLDIPIPDFEEVNLDAEENKVKVS